MVVGEYELILADDATPGEYQIKVGMYNWVPVERLAVSEEWAVGPREADPGFAVTLGIC